jgi:Fur family ferric uptake transcriptional regulator
MNNKQLKNAGLKTTLPRVRILETIEQSENGHLSAEDIYRLLRENGEQIGLATVYRVLTQLETAGILRRQRFGDAQARFEIETGEHHDHIVCVKCGKVVEFHAKRIEDEQRKVALENGFKIKGHEMVLYGICDATLCRAR